MTAPLIERLGWTLVHTLWQFAALALLLMVLLRLLAGCGPQARYSSAALTMLSMCLAAAITFLAPSLGTTNREEAPASISQHRALMSDVEHAPPLTIAADAPLADDLPTRWLAWRQQLHGALEPWLTKFVAAWLLGVTLLSLRPLAGWHAVRRLRSIGTSPASQEVLDLTHRTARRLNVTPAVRVMQSSLVSIPAVIGWLEPLILLPLGLASGLTPAQLEAVLAHELAHIRRRDYAVNVLQTLVETLCFYHPAVWWVSRQMRIEREDCCDDVALSVCSDRRQYARTLLALDELRGPVPLAAMSAGGGSLLARIRRIVAGGSPAHSRLSGIVGAVTGLALVVTLGMFAMSSTSPTWAEEPSRTSTEPVSENRRQERHEPQPTDPPTGTPWVRGVAADPWFWPDPYSHLGHDVPKGPGWQYARIAADDATGKDLGTTQQQREALREVYREFEQRERDLGKKAREEAGKVDAAASLARRQDAWLQAREAARALLTDAQHRRVEQLVIQRQSYHVFRSGDLAARLELSEEQRRKITAAIDAHHRRVEEETLELGRTTQRLALDQDNPQLAEQIRQMSAAKGHRGRLSHRRVWDEIREVLAPAQREQFVSLRGPMAAPARQRLPLFEPSNGVERR